MRPIEIDGRVLVDGAAVNPLPFDCLRGRADVVVAVDTSIGPTMPRGIPDPWDALFSTIQVMGDTIIAEKLKHGAPDLLLRPPVGGIPAARFPARERDPARRRTREGRGKGAAGGGDVTRNVSDASSRFFPSPYEGEGGQDERSEVETG